ncbi:hypothetical protein Q2941_04740 [Bradyrhizobium sp. UFLA05-153]
MTLVQKIDRPFLPDPVLMRSNEQRSWYRAITADALSKLGRGKPETILKSEWPRDERAALIHKAAVSPTSTAQFPPHTIVETFRSLAPGSAAIKLFNLGLKLDLNSATTVTVPNAVAQAGVPIFVGEGLPAPAVQLSFAGAVVGPARKILILSAVSQELEDANPDNASAIIGKVLSDRSNAAIDKVAFGSQADDGVTPKGLLNGVTPLTPTAVTGNDPLGSALVQDLGNLVGAIGAAGIDPSDTVFVAGPREALILSLRAQASSFSVLMTLGLPAKSVMAVAPSAIASGYREAPAIETSKHAAFHAEDTAPLPLVGSGSPAVVAAPQRSMFQTNCIAVRVRAWVAWAAASGGVQWVQNINW